MIEEEKLMFEHHRRKLSSNFLDFVFLETIAYEIAPYIRWGIICGLVVLVGVTLV